MKRKRCLDIGIQEKGIDKMVICFLRALILSIIGLIFILKMLNRPTIKEYFIFCFLFSEVILFIIIFYIGAGFI